MTLISGLFTKIQILKNKRTNRRDISSFKYEASIKKGDILLQSLRHKVINWNLAKSQDNNFNVDKDLIYCHSKIRRQILKKWNITIRILIE